MRYSEPRSLRRTENARPIGTSAWCFGPRLDNVEDRTSPATFSGARNLELNRVDRVILQNHASQVVDVDRKEVSIEPVFVTERQIRDRVQSQGERHIELPE
jgi:hypothetical protein